MVVIAINANRTLKQIETSNAALRQELLGRERLLHRLRLDLYRSSIVIRDYLLDPEPSQADRRRRDLEGIRNEIDAVLGQYKGSLTREESVFSRAGKRPGPIPARAAADFPMGFRDHPRAWRRVPARTGVPAP